MRLLLLTILRQQPISRVRLARATQLSSTTVTNLTTELIADGVLDVCGLDADAQTPGAGRPPVALMLRPESRYAIGVHIGVRWVRVALVDLQANIRQFVEFGVHAGEAPEPVIARIADLIAAMVRQFGLEVKGDIGAQGRRIVGVGVGASGLVESGSGVNILAPNLGWENLPLRELLATELEAQLGPKGALPVVVDNNVRCMALAESLYGVGRNVRALAYVYARMGVGAGLVVDGEIYRGADYGAGEVGHWVMMPTGGALCSCGNRGCLETYISEAVLLEMAEKVHPELTTGRSEPLKVLFDAARDGHLGLIELLEDRAFYVGLALANVVNVLNPQLLMLGGWLHDAFDLIEPVVQRTLRKHAFGGIGRHVDVLPSSFGGYSGVTGAATLAFERFFFSRGIESAAQMQPAQAPWVVAGRLPRE
jgi:predicted NBD/HSP70 family sugar kinase